MPIPRHRHKTAIAAHSSIYFIYSTHSQEAFEPTSKAFFEGGAMSPQGVVLHSPKAVSIASAVSFKLTTMYVVINGSECTTTFESQSFHYTMWRKKVKSPE